MKIFIFILFFVNIISALPAPYLISVTAESDSSINLVWRNNSSDYTEVIILRKKTEDSLFQPINRVPGTINTYSDKPLYPYTTFWYSLVALSQTDTSESSNIDSATILLDTVFQAPVIKSVVWNGDLSNNTITFTDKSNIDIGYKLLRSEDLGPYVEIRKVIWDLPFLINRDTSIIDANISLNKWYTYKLEIFKEDSSLSSSDTTVYTYKPLINEKHVKFTKEGELPVNGVVWAAIKGDSIILKEEQAPPNSYSVINISNINNPLFAGYTDSATLIKYPISTLIPFYLQYPEKTSQAAFDKKALIYNSENILLIDSNNLFICDTTLSKLDSAVFSVEGKIRPNSKIIGTYKDTLFLSMDYYSVDGPLYSEWHQNIYPIKLTNSQLLYDDTPNVKLTGYSGTTSNQQFQIFGLCNNNLFYRDFNGYTGDCTNYLCNVLFKTKTIIPGPSRKPNTQYLNQYIQHSVQVVVENDKLFAFDIHNHKEHEKILSQNLFLHDSLLDVKTSILDTSDKILFLFCLKKLFIASYELADWPISIKSKFPSKKTKNFITIIPNSFNNQITIKFLQNPDYMVIFDCKGRIIKQFNHIVRNSVTWNARSTASGMYFIQCVTGRSKYSGKILIHN